MAKKYYWLLAILTLIYLGATFAVSPDPATLTLYHINETQLRLLALAIALPLIAIWVIAFYGFTTVSKYTAKIKDSPDGDGFKFLTYGLTSLGISLPVTSAISSLLNFAVHVHGITQSAAVIINTHVAIVFPFVGFILLLIGSDRLLKLTKKASVSSSQTVGFGLLLAVVSIFYVIVTFMNASRQTPIAPATKATYYMPDWLILTTIVLPYILIWGCGLYTALRLGAYQQNVKGQLYKSSLSKLNLGFISVILASIVLQLLTGLGSSLVSWGLSSIVALVYVLLVMIAVGYVFIALGAKDLARLEEVT